MVVHHEIRLHRRELPQPLPERIQRLPDDLLQQRRKPVPLRHLPTRPVPRPHVHPVPPPPQPQNHLPRIRPQMQPRIHQRPVHVKENLKPAHPLTIEETPPHPRRSEDPKTSPQPHPRRSEGPNPACLPHPRPQRRSQPARLPHRPVAPAAPQPDSPAAPPPAANLPPCPKKSPPACTSPKAKPPS